ncbi:MAG TPA: DUF1553 domain-containing protein [Tepidisphaeraceae bacterium]|nr:DUF1553 domain-containing protein [Tepidisphaeraceae bacterium]
MDFARDVQPILSDACYHCHGPDEHGRKAKLRVDTKEGAFKVVDGKPLIVPGKAGESELVRRLTTKDEDDLMPPPDSNRKLTAKQVETIRRWVEQGAEWGEHWAFRPIVRPAVPKPRTAWGHNRIDAFVLARLEKERLAPADEAARAALIRRATLDLTGLPPTMAEVEAFVADTSPDAYDKVVDRLLASPRYGERLASEWLDLARYADTHGYQMDRYRATWAYRDWVIKAINENLPFDQFATWQLAGDLLPNATKEQRLATAFNRLHTQNEEGGIVEEEFRVAYVTDRVNTFGTAFLGMTFECSRCHDHKYDPISQKDFYAMFAFFQNIDESGQTTYFTDATPVPAMLLSTEEQDRKLAELERKVGEAERGLTAARVEAAGRAQAFWAMPREGRAPAVVPVGAWAFDRIEKNAVKSELPNGKPAVAFEATTVVAAPTGMAAKLSGENGFRLPDVGHFSRSDPFTIDLVITPGEIAPRQVVLHHSKAPIDAGSRGYEVLLEDGRVAVGLHHMWPGNSLKVATRDAVMRAGAEARVTVTYDGSSRAAGVRVYVGGAFVALDVVRDGLTKDITYGGKEPELTVGQRFRDNGFRGGMIHRLAVFDRELSPLEVRDYRHPTAGAVAKLWAGGAGAAPADEREADGYYVEVVAPEVQKAKAALRTARAEHAKFVNAIPELMVMRELPQPKQAFVLKRGAYDAPGDAVSAETPRVMPKMAEGLPRNRLGLAKWLVDLANPLIARVTVNRAWQQMFGRGIVETSDNFGLQGSPPTHPELLDWLARVFVDDLKWDYKALLKLIASSATYRQSSRASAELLARDPQNELLARGPARRLTAEMLRDQALAVSGLLVEKVGGPSVKPYQPAGLWEEIAMGRPNYGQGKGADLYRRSLYTFWKRTVPPPAMMTLDAADRSYCTVKRQSTSTPLQALALLNDVQQVEAARQVGQRMIKEGGKSDGERAAWAFRLVTGRAAGEKELAVLVRVLAEQRAIFSAEPGAAKKLISMGESKADAAVDPVELAAGTVLAQALLNHDEALMRR